MFKTGPQYMRIIYAHQDLSFLPLKPKNPRADLFCTEARVLAYPVRLIDRIPDDGKEIRIVGSCSLAEIGIEPAGTKFRSRQAQRDILFA